MFVLLVLTSTLVVAIYFWQKTVFKYWTDRGIPQLKPTFPLGTIRLDKHFAYHIEAAYNAYKDKSKYVGMYNSLLPQLLILDKDIIKTVLTTDFESLSSHGTYFNEKDDPLTANVFTLYGQRWKDVRTKLNPNFTPAKIKMSCPTIVDIGHRLKETMDRKLANGHGAGIDMNDLFERYTVDSIGAYAFGIECNSFNDPNALFRKMGMKFFIEDLTAVKMFTLGAFPKLAKKLGFKTLSTEVNEFFQKIVNETVNHRTKNGIKRNDLLDTLIALRNKDKSNSLRDSYKEGWSMNQIAAQCFTFFGASFEATTFSSLFTLFELAKNQDIQDKLRSHIRTVLKEHNGEMTYEALKDMTYLEQCYKEGLRIYPPLAMLLRRVTRDYKLPDTDIVLPKGTDVGIPVYAIQRDPEIYPNPEQFNPERFTPEEEAKRHFSSWLPFGEGPRHCIGEIFGIMQVKIGLANLIGNYRFRVSSKGSSKIIFDKKVLASTAHGLYFDVEEVD